jgi:ATP-dependent Clp protease, protease subunit
MNLSSPFSIPLLLGLLFRMNGSHGYSIANHNNNEYARNADQSFSQLSVVRQTMALSMSQQREPIRMPSSNPMVPYKVSPSLILPFLGLAYITIPYPQLFTPATCLRWNQQHPSGYTQFIDIESAFYRDRTMFISRYIDEEAANGIISILLYLRDQSPKDTIFMYFNVPGAQLRPALAIYDLMQNTKKNCEIHTVNLALTAGMGSFLCAAGTKGKRSALPNSRFMLQRTGMDQVFRGQATDIALEVRNVKGINDRMETELAVLTGQPVDRIRQDLKRDFYLSSDEAVQYGLIDQVLLPSPRKRAAQGKDADLGAFEGEQQRFQKEDSKGGWGARTKEGPPSGGSKRSNDDDQEPKIAKG